MIDFAELRTVPNTSKLSKTSKESSKKSKKTTQPEKIRTAGSTFKNPKKSIGKKAWELIEESGLRSFKMNGISLSPKHANFIVNQQFKSSNMIEDFGEVIREKVFNQTGIMLDWEIQIIGDR